MIATNYLSILAGLASVSVAQDPFYMCTESTCQNCPSSVASTGTGYPNCVIYNSEDVFANQGYDGADGGGYNVYFDVQAHETGCATIIKSPANTDIIGCGVVIGAFKQPACAVLSLETSFMVQSCCGDACDSAGAKMIRGLGPMGSIRSVSIDGSGGLLLKNANGSVIEPAEIGSPPELANVQKEKRSLQKRSCTKNSWQGGSTYTKPADNVQIVASNVAGPGTVTITKERTQTWSTSMSLGIADILSLGVSAEFSESVSSSKSVTRELAEGQSGNMGFTAYLTCSEGKGQCDSGEVEGEVCWPTMDGEDVMGKYQLIVDS